VSAAEWAVRSYILENGEEVHLDEGPWDRCLAELILADIGIDATIPRGLGRAEVRHARIVPANEADF
jgi:hypothetical protein